MPAASQRNHPPATASVSRGEAIAMLAIGNTLWGGTYAAGKQALSCLSFVELNAVRFSIATVLMAPALWSGRRLIAAQLRGRRSMWELARLVLLGFVLNKAFEYAGLAMSTAVDVALLIAAESLFTAILSWTVLGERVTRSGVAALVAGGAGVYLVVARGIVPTVEGPGGAARILGDLLVVAALFFEAGYTITGKASLARVPPLLLTSISVAGSLAVWIPTSAIEIAREGLPHMTAAAWLSVAYMAAFGTVAGYWMWFRALSRVGASVAAPFLFIQPLVGAALGVVLLGESLTLATVVGAALILASLAMVTAGARSPEEAALLLPEIPE